MIRNTKHGWVNLSNLPKKGRLFDWKNSIGTTIEFCYKDVHSYMLVEDYVDIHHLKISTPECGDSRLISIENILAGKFGRMVGEIVPEFRYQIGDVIHDTILILSMYKKGRYKYYNYKCLIDGYEGHIAEDDLRRGKGCPVCSNHVVMRGINDIATTNPYVASLFLNTEDAYKYTACSAKNVDFVCHRCGNIINKQIYIVTEYGLSCRKCSDGISYSEKFIYNVLQQVLGFNFDTQRMFIWSKNIYHLNKKLAGNKIYDFYIPLEIPIIIEAHGEQHFKQCLYHRYKDAKSLEEEQENDRLKMNIAIKNGILPHNYIQLDCCESKTEYIKKSIMNSTLPRLLDFTEEQIDWEQCNLFATSSRMLEICDLWNSGEYSVKSMSSQTKLNRSTILRYLRRGEELGIVQNPPKHIKKKTQQND